jgi:hypothetical protein
MEKAEEEEDKSQPLQSPPHHNKVTAGNGGNVNGRFHL